MKKKKKDASRINNSTPQIGLVLYEVETNRESNSKNLCVEKMM